MKKTIIDDITYLRRFMPTTEINAMVTGMGGEEGAFFREKITTIAAFIREMPTTYGQEGKGELATAYLHYFGIMGDWYITERDGDGPQLQAFGFARIAGHEDCAEIGYISIAELIKNGVELDLHFAPMTIQEIKFGMNEVPF